MLSITVYILPNLTGNVPVVEDFTFSLHFISFPHFGRLPDAVCDCDTSNNVTNLSTALNWQNVFSGVGFCCANAVINAPQSFQIAQGFLIISEQGQVPQLHFLFIYNHLNISRVIKAGIYLDLILCSFSVPLSSAVTRALPSRL